MLKVIKSLLLNILDNIDTGNSNICEEDEVKIIELLKTFTDKTERLSKYKACQYLNVRRPTFDNYVREGKLPRGRKEAGFNELSWSKKDLDDFILKYRKRDSHNTSEI